MFGLHSPIVQCLSRKQKSREDSITSDQIYLLKAIADNDDSAYTCHTTRASRRPSTLHVVDRMAINRVTDQHPLSRFLGKMSTATRMGPSNLIYRSVFQTNGVQIDHTGKKYPPIVVNPSIVSYFCERSTKLLSEEVVDVRRAVLQIESEPEECVRDLASTALLPISYRDQARGGDIIWNTECLPNDPNYPHIITAPKPDIHIGYSNDTRELHSIFLCSS